MCCRWAARLDCRPCAPGAAPFPPAFPWCPRASPGSPVRRRPARPVRPLPLPASPLRSGARLVRCRPDLAPPGTPCASRRLCRHSAPHSLNRPRGFTPGRSKLWERRPSLAASLISSAKSFRACRAFPWPFSAPFGTLPVLCLHGRVSISSCPPLRSPYPPGWKPLPLLSPLL